MKTVIFNAKSQSREERKGFSFLIFLLLSISALNIFAQETPPAPGAPRSVRVPAVQEKKLANGLTVAVVQKTATPIVTIQLLVKCGASCEDDSKAGLADITASMLTKGTKTRSATQIAEAIEFLGGSISSGAGWNSSFVSVTVTSDKVGQAMAILADVVLNPIFDQKELDLLKSQTLDGLTYNLKQPSFLANYVASKYSFGEHPAGGTPQSIQSIASTDIWSFHKKHYLADRSILIFTGAISPSKADILGSRFFGNMEMSSNFSRSNKDCTPNHPQRLVARLLVVDVPQTGQASVNYYNKFRCTGRESSSYYPTTVMNTVLGGGYSARLNYEIRIKRGLSYGAGSSVSWRRDAGNFSTRAQTKNESAAQVAELTLEELKKLASDLVLNNEMVPRKSVLTGNFGRNLETTGGLAAALGDLYSFGIPSAELSSYVSKVNSVTESQLRDIAKSDLPGGDIIIVGDYSIFKDDLAKRFPGMKVDVIKADELDLSRDDLRK